MIKIRNIFKCVGVSHELSDRENAWGLIFVWPAYLYYIPTLLQYGILYYYGITAARENTELLNALLNFSVGGFSAILVILTFRKFIALNIAEFSKTWWKDILWLCTFGYTWTYLSSMIGSMIIYSVIGNVSSQSGNQELFETLQVVSPVFMFCNAVIFAPIVEELVFRGMIFSNIVKKNAILAHIVSALAFGFLHVYSFILQGDFVQLIFMIPYVLMSLAFSYAYHKRGNIIVPILLHSLSNIIAFLVTHTK